MKTNFSINYNLAKELKILHSLKKEKMIESEYFLKLNLKFYSSEPLIYKIENLNTELVSKEDNIVYFLKKTNLNCMEYDEKNDRFYISINSKINNAAYLKEKYFVSPTIEINNNDYNNISQKYVKNNQISLI